jgi:phosphoribosylformimino-5-aminoimidazole carboxamide ribotide isomerase
MLIIPAIDLRHGRCVRLTQGRKDNATIYHDDPLEIALGYQASGAPMIHIVDLDSAFSDSSSRNWQVLGKIVSQLGIPLQFGGGLRSIRDVERVIELGVARVVIGTLAVEQPHRFDEMLRSFGADRIAVGIDARAGRVLTRGWEKEAKVSAVELAKEIALRGAERIVYTDVARDGMLTGVNIEQTCMIARESGLKVTASGGVSSLDDIRRLLKVVGNVDGSLGSTVGVGSIDSLIVGKALLEGRFTLQEALLTINGICSGDS